MGKIHAPANETAFATDLEACAKLLIEKLQANQYQEASAVIHKLYEVRDQHIFNSIGQLTRTLHDAIVNFNIDAELGGVRSGLDGHDIRDASDRLNYVITTTQNAANRTMDRVEAAAPVAMRLGQEAESLRAEWAKLRRRELSRTDFAALYGRMEGFLQQMDNDARELNEGLQSIILEQGYQDLTGQVLRKVIGLITDVEAELVNLVRIAGQVDKLAGIDHGGLTRPARTRAKGEAEGPQIHAQHRADVVSGQDEVDDLLSSLGF